MRVHLIKKQTVEDYIARENQSKIPLEKWLTRIKEADWDKPMDIILTFNDSDLLGKSSRRVVFNIGGNKYRMICHYHFGKMRVHLFISWIGTHKEYTKVCASGKQYYVNKYR